MRRQSGMALLALIVLMAVAILSLWQPRVSPEAEHRRSQRVLQEALQALVAYASQAHSSGVQMERLRMGELPCPDVDGDGVINPTIDYTGSDCTAYVGWLPWRSLGLPEGKDGTGARLWYVLAPAWANRAGGVEAVLNPDQTDRVWLDGQAAVAWLISPSAPLPQQQRDIASDGASQIAHYLEWSALGPQQWQRQAASNDRALALGADRLLYSAEQVAIKAVAGWLNGFYRDQHHYPSAAPLAGQVCQAGVSVGELPSACPTSLALPWPESDDMDAWLLRNQWLAHIEYRQLSSQRVQLVGPQQRVEIASGVIQ